MFSAYLWLSTSTSKLPFLVYLTVFGLALVEITFSLRKGVNLARQTSSKDSITMNLGKSAASFSESDSERFRLVFIWRWHICSVFFAGPALHHSPLSPTCVGNEWIKGLTHSPWLRRGYATSILELRVGFRGVTNFRFSVLVKFLFSQHNWHSATAF